MKPFIMENSNLNDLRVVVKKNLIYDPKLKSYEIEFIKKILALYPKYIDLKIFLDGGLIVTFFDDETKKNVIIHSGLTEKDELLQIVELNENIEIKLDSDYS